jgi:hypothetical protein
VSLLIGGRGVQRFYHAWSDDFEVKVGVYGI